VNGKPDCAIRNLVLVEREDGPQQFYLPSGKVILFGFTGVTTTGLRQIQRIARIDRTASRGWMSPNNKSEPHVTILTRRGLVDDGRTYDDVVGLRAVTSTDGVTLIVHLSNLCRRQAAQLSRHRETD
jgi:hypothetical protein